MTVLQKILFAREKVLETGEQIVLHPWSFDILEEIAF